MTGWKVYGVRTDLPYGFGLARNHPYRDGNKRVSFMAMYTVLGVNGHEIIAEEPEVVRLMMGVAGGARGGAALAKWLREHTMPFAD